ncbi:glycosyl transferase [Prochlorococcus sp. MIT 1341]|uniref:glycosyl transferase n=1 Tax=Prochlorococcus sp. MIT 1341 TaxID=3096221 RepID=UPI002A74FF82|nr:glycosyl transferase [Prochlorococcus sp. MIT 1341]
MIELDSASRQDNSFSVVLVSNGPGELATWVRPLAESLHTRLLMRPLVFSAETSLHLVLVPCPNATGKEADTAKKWGYFESVNEPSQFWDLLLRPKRYLSLPRKGLVVFLGGDQFWTVLLSARLGYKHLTYAEWIARWPAWNDRIAAMSAAAIKGVPRNLQSRCTVVGDLMADLSTSPRAKASLPKGEWIALMPGSKKSKLCVGVPFLLEVADHLSSLRPGCNFLLPIAPTTSLEEIQRLSTPTNPITAFYSSRIDSVRPSLASSLGRRIFTVAGTEIFLEEEQPAYGSLSQCDLALTTVGANTAELGALSVPMIVILPTQHLAVMQAWDGFLGLLGRLPGLKWCIGALLSFWRLSRRGFLAWPNISASRMVVPERIGRITPRLIAEEAAAWLASPERLSGQREDLRSLRGKPGAVKALTNEVCSFLPKTYRED